MPHLIDLNGLTFGRLTALSSVAKSVGSQGKVEHYWHCTCSCGKNTTVSGARLRGGRTRSCGCLNKETIRKISTKYGGYNHPLVSTWKNMHSRCYNEKHTKYADYGGRGIKICPRWHRDNPNGFWHFVADMGPKPSMERLPSGRPMYTLDRRENDEGYSPWNCKWSTVNQQMGNRRAFRKKQHSTSEYADCR